MPSALPIRFAYTAAGYFLTPALQLWLARRTTRGKEDVQRRSERFGHTIIPRPPGSLIWCHAASVGETQSVLTLVRALLDARPACHLLITTGTLTSAALVAQQNLPRVIHQFVPVDTHAAVARFLQHWRPDLALWVESEFWPQLLWQTQARAIPMLLVNARLSAKSQAGWAKWSSTIRSLLECFTAIYAGSSEDASRLTTLGAQNVHDIGNLKYDAAPLPEDPQLMADLRTISTTHRILLAASTHANEEQQLAEIHTHVAQQFPNLLTIIVPRHATRGDAIAADLRERGFHLAQRSKQEAVIHRTQIYLADTMGELGSFYRHAEVVFIGGSLVAHGGQNPLEPARLGNALVSGPHVHNFAAIMRHLGEAHAIRIVADKATLASELANLLANESARAELARNARGVVEKARGASAAILQHCLTLLPAETA